MNGTAEMPWVVPVLVSDGEQGSAWDNGEALERALDQRTDGAYANVRVPPGTYTIDRTLTLHTGQYLIGSGPTSTAIRLAADSNCALLETEGFASHKGQNHWNVADGVPHGFGVEAIRFDGNAAENPDGGDGLRIYGKRYILRDVLVMETRGVGIYSECARLGGQEGWRDAPSAFWDNVRTRNTGSHAVLFRGPHDSVISSLICQGAGTVTEIRTVEGSLKPVPLRRPDVDGVVFDARTGDPEHFGDDMTVEKPQGSYAGGCRVRYLHSYGHSGVGVRFVAHCYCDEVEGHNCVKEGVVVESSRCTFGLINAQQNDTQMPGALGPGETRADEGYFNVRISGSYNQISRLATMDRKPANLSNVREPKPVGGGVKITGSRNTISSARLFGAADKDAEIDASESDTAVLYRKLFGAPEEEMHERLQLEHWPMLGRCGAQLEGNYNTLHGQVFKYHVGTALRTGGPSVKTTKGQDVRLNIEDCAVGWEAVLKVRGSRFSIRAKRCDPSWPIPPPTESNVLELWNNDDLVWPPSTGSRGGW